MFTCVLGRCICCFHSLITQTFCLRSVDGQLRGDKDCPVNGVTGSGGVWRKVQESDARSVGEMSQAVLALIIITLLG